MSPGLPTRTVTFVLLGESCVVLAVATALGSLALCGRSPVALLEAEEPALFPWVTVPGVAALIDPNRNVAVRCSGLL